MGDYLRVFNPNHGEWRAKITQINRNDLMVQITEQLRRPPPDDRPKRHLFFAPVKKNQQDLIIEKSTELGVTDLHPMMTQFTQTRRVNLDRYWDQARNAAEQCERLTIPKIHDPVSFNDLLHDNYLPDDTAIYAALARAENIPSLATTIYRSSHNHKAILIGPEGGFSQDEQLKLGQHPDIQSVHLGPTILRAETAVIAALSVLHINVTT